jgi:hypothetical protein
VRQPQSQKHKYLRRVAGTVLAVATLIALGIEIYEFEIVGPRIEMLPVGLNAPFSFRIVNASYLDFLRISPTCEFSQMMFRDNRVNGLTLNDAEGSPKDIPAGGDKLFSCGLKGTARTTGKMKLTLDYFIHCVPLVRCSRKSVFHLKSLPDGTWIEGETFELPD